MIIKTAVFFLMLLIQSASSSAETISVRIPVEEFLPEIMNGTLGTWIGIPGIPSIQQIGAPTLPAVPIKIGLPMGCRALSAGVSEIEYTEWRWISSIIPVSRQVPVSKPWEFEQAEPDPLIYLLDNFYPDTAVLFTGSSVIWGIPVATLTVNPVQWNPVSGELKILNYLQLELLVEFDPSLSTVIRRTQSSEFQAINLARKLVVNPEDVSGSGAVLVDEKDLEYGQYVIICPADYEDEMQVLADWKTSKGVPARVYTTDWIEANYSFLDLQREIRAFLTDCRDEGTDYVLLAGDDDVLEARDVYLRGGIRPSDLYFSDNNDAYPGEDLWDSNRNGYWGEPGDVVDWHPDLWVARASVNCDTEAELFVNKVFYYEHVNQVWPAGRMNSEPLEMRIGYSTGLLSANPECWGSAGAEIISGYIPAGWQEEKRYESESNNSSALTVEMINMGMHHIYHSSHGAPTFMWTSWGSKFGVYDIFDLVNISDGHNVSIWNSISCKIGAFDTLTCCADAWISSPDGGGFGAFNSDNGYFSSGNPGNGASEQLCQRFYYEYLINDVYNLGIAHGVSLDFFCPPNWNTYFDYIIKGYNLFGDPELPMWTEEHSSLSVLHPSSINGNSTIDVTVTSTGTPLENARVCIQKGDWQSGEVYDVGYTDASGNAQLWADPETTGQMDITVWAHNHDHYSGLIDVTTIGIEPEPRTISYSLEQVYPNPASGSVAITYTTASTGPVELAVYDMHGRQVSILVANSCSPGRYTYLWDLGSTGTSVVSSGLYFVRFTAESYTDSEPLLILR